MTFKELESTREEYYNLVIRIRRSCLIVGLILAFFIATAPLFHSGRYYFYNFFQIFIYLAFAFIISQIITYFIAKKPREKYEACYKDYFILRSLKTVFSDVEYLPNQGLFPEYLQSTGMVTTCDRYHSNDFVKAKYKDVGFTQADVHIESEHKDSDGNKHYVTIFRGRWMTFEFPKKFAFKLEVVQKGFGCATIPYSSKTGKRLAKIETESVNFNKNFRIYAEDGFEMFYILTPDIVARIEDMAASPNTSFILCFIDNMLHVGFHNNTDAFEAPNPKYKIDEKAECEKVSKDISLIIKFVDALKLDRNLFKN